MESKKKDVKLIAGLWLLIAPTALFIVTILLYAITNFVFFSADGGSDIVRVTLNIVLFVASSISIITWLPGIVVGIVLLATRK
jgi:hypothetical protein